MARGSALAGADAPSSAATFSPGSPTIPIRLPTGSSSPAAAATLSRVPAAGDSTSYSTLSVWMRTMGWPLSTFSPSCFSHWRIVPVSIVRPS
jgi:hypothetical protein